MKKYIIFLCIFLAACATIEEIPEEELEEILEEVEEPEIIEESEVIEEEQLVVEVEKIEEPEPTEPEPEAIEEPTEPEYQGKVFEVIIENLELKPKIVKITVGDTIVWKIRDKVSVKLYSSYFKPSVLYYGDEFALKFERPGIFPYTDEYHRAISGEIHVAEQELMLEEPVEEPPENIHFVKIEDYQYKPKILSIKREDIVIWEAFDPTAQTVDGAGFSSGPLRKGDKFHHQFNLTGEFPYSSIFRKNLIGTIIVEE